ncbi:hypothetical protein Rhopal_006075-T1 [Rhodotorula paludigena]|uniref:NDT80 domain-containing protein n=1 Tax=Rhodotorula paludigena TaxID=86838 RepID=A0AAV5GU48_9BASI|nr:hypothetical protein Rhopal_006075-T1 [Rhodotorula paludigena]
MHRQNAHYPFYPTPENTAHQMRHGCGPAFTPGLGVSLFASVASPRFEVGGIGAGVGLTPASVDWQGQQERAGIYGWANDALWTSESAPGECERNPNTLADYLPSPESLVWQPGVASSPSPFAPPPLIYPFTPLSPGFSASPFPALSAGGFIPMEPHHPTMPQLDVHRQPALVNEPVTAGFSRLDRDRFEYWLDGAHVDRDANTIGRAVPGHALQLEKVSGGSTVPPLPFPADPLHPHVEPVWSFHDSERPSSPLAPAVTLGPETSASSVSSSGGGSGAKKRSTSAQRRLQSLSRQPEKRPASNKPSGWNSLSEFWAPWEKTASVLDAEGKELAIETAITTPSSFYHDESASSWLTYRRNNLSTTLSLTLPSSFQLDKLYVARPGAEPPRPAPISHLVASLSAAKLAAPHDPVELSQYALNARKLASAKPVKPQRLSRSASVATSTKSSPSETSASDAASQSSPFSSSASHVPHTTSTPPAAPSSARSRSAPAVSLSTTFARIQFRHSTHNKRLNASAAWSAAHGPHSAGAVEPDERFVLRCTVWAVLEPDEGEEEGEQKVELGAWSSAPIVVRGRSPGNFGDGGRRRTPQRKSGEERRGKRGRRSRRDAEEEDDIAVVDDDSDSSSENEDSPTRKSRCDDDDDEDAPSSKRRRIEYTSSQLDALIANAGPQRLTRGRAAAALEHAQVDDPPAVDRSHDLVV